MNPIKHQFDSSSLESAIYVPASETLMVQFKNGGTYQYFGVPANSFDELRSAGSAGGHFAKYIRDVFLFKAIDPSEYIEQLNAQNIPAHIFVMPEVHGVTQCYF